MTYALNYIYLSSSHAGGKDQVALNLLEGIYDNGKIDDCVVFCYDYSVDIIRQIAPGVRIESIPSKPVMKKKELIRLLHIVYVNTFVIPKLLKAYNADVIFHASCTNGLRKDSVPSVMIPHDIKAVSHRVLGDVKVSFYKYILYKIMYAADFRHADRIVAISQADQKEMQQYYPKYKDKIVQIYNPIKVNTQILSDTDFSTVSGEKKEQSGSQGDIVAINLQFHHKNIITLIKAYEKIKDRVNSNLVLIGAVPPRVHYLIDYVKEHGLADRVHFTGFIDAKRKRKLLVSSALYVNPSLFEGFGMTAVEAMILEVPTLLAKVSTNSEVTKGMCSYYEPANDVDALADAILNCLGDSWKEDELKEKSRVMQKAYDYRVIADQYMNLFYQVGENA